jgi:hypothetical protein
MSKRVRGYMFGRERRYPLRSGPNVLKEFEAHAGCSQWPAKPIHKDRFVLRSRLSPKEGRKQGHGFRPEWTETLFAPFAKQPDLRRRIQPEGARAQVERLLYPGTRVEEEREQDMVTLAQGG